MDTPVTDLALARQQRLEALRAAYPRWRVWCDDAGWHAMRRGNFRERRQPGSAAYAIHMPSPVLLTVHLAVEDAMEAGNDWRP